MSATDRVSSLLVSTNLPSSRGGTDLVAIDERPAVRILAEIGPETPGRQQPAGGLGMIGAERHELGLQLLQQPLAPVLLARCLLAVQTQDVPTPTLALADDHLLGVELGGDRGVAAGPRQDLVADLLHLGQRCRQHIAAGTAGELGEVGLGVEPGIADK
jgi:hypothetical protein